MACFRLLAPWVIFVATPLAHTAEIDKFYPADTSIVVNLNVKQLLAAPLVKKHGLAPARDALKSMDQVQSVLEELGFDPFTDLDRLVVCGPGGDDKERGLVIAHGKFELSKFKARAEKAAEENGEVLTIERGPAGTVYAIAGAKDGNPIFVALPNKNTIVASLGKDYVVEALKKESGKAKAGLVDKAFQNLLEQMNAEQSLSVAAVGSALKGAELGPASEVLEKLEGIGGGLTLDAALVAELTFATRSADDAKEFKKVANDGLNKGIGLLSLLTSQAEQLAPIIDVLKTIKATSRDKTVTLKAQLSAEALENLFNDSKDK